MIDHCRAGAPHEACGLLSGVAPLVSAFHPLNNIKASETRYLADPADLIRAVEAIRLAKTEILAIYHSHPRSPAIPSQVDLRENYYDDVPRIIVSLMGEPPDVRTWRLWPDHYDELPWAVAP
jgi:proteasome lid subunit RPN8/RPN11